MASNQSRDMFRPWSERAEEGGSVSRAKPRCRLVISAVSTGATKNRNLWGRRRPALDNRFRLNIFATVHRVPKTVRKCFCQNFVKFPPTFRQRTTALNGRVPNSHNAVIIRPPGTVLCFTVYDFFLARCGAMSPSCLGRLP